MTDFINIPTHHILVTIEKIDASPDPKSPPRSWESWIIGSFENQSSLPISYSLRGYLMAPIQYGYPMEVFGIERNGVEVYGIFCSTPIVEIWAHGLIETYTSIYRLIVESGLTKEVR